MGMMTIFELVGKIAINKGTADQDIDETAKKGKTLASQFDTIAEKAGTLSKKAAAAGAKLSVAVTVPLVALGKQIYNQASNLDATNAKFHQVFGEMSGDIDNYLKDFKKLSPITQAEARTMASGFQDLLVPMGFARDTATGMTKEFMTLSGALYQANSDSRTQEEVTLALQSAMTGEYESLKALGIQINENTVKQKIQSMGLQTGTDDLDRQAKAQAVLALMTEQSSDALAVFSEENLDAKTKVGISLAKIKDIGAEIGQRFLPAVVRIAEKIADLAGWFGSLNPVIQDAILGVGAFAALLGPLLLVVSGIAGAISNLAGLFGTGGLLSGIAGTTTATGGMGAALSAVLGPIAAVAAGIGGLIAILVGAWQNSEKLRGRVFSLAQTLSLNAKIAIDKIITALEPAKKAFQDLWTSLGPVLKQIGDFIATYVIPIVGRFALVFINAFQNIIIGMAPFLTAIGNLFSFIANFVGMVFALLNGDWSAAMDFGKKALQSLLDAVVNIWNGIWGTISAVMNAIFALISAIWGSIVGTISNLLTSIWNNITTAWNNIINTTQRILGNLRATVVGGFQGAIDFIAGLPGAFSQYGKDMIQSLIDGINNMITNAAEAIKGIAESIKTAFCEALGIHSPSTWFFEKAGNMVQGLVNGWKNSHFAQWVDNTVEWMKEKFKGSTDAIMGFFSKMGSGALDFLKNTFGIDLSGLFGGGAGIGSSLGWIWPSDTTEITDYFGNRESPGGVGSTNHQGIDIGAAYGTPIYAPSSGTVEIAGGYGGYGNAVKLDMGGGFETLFGHMSSVAVSVGQAVSKGQVIGYVGSTGNSTGPHIHYSVFVNGQMVDPMDFYAFANGGIVDKPTWGVFGEAGKEANIPLQNNRARGIELWKESGRILGMTGGSSDEDGLAAKIGTAVAAALKAAGITGTNLKIETHNYTPNPSPSETERATMRALRKAGLHA